MKHSIFLISMIVSFIFLSCSQSQREDNAIASKEEVSNTEMLNETRETTSSDITTYANQKSLKATEHSSNLVELDESSKDVVQTTRPNYIPSMAALSVNDTDFHKFIRTALLQFKVDAVSESTLAIEDIVLRNGGFIIKSAISNENKYTAETNISPDSAIVTYYSNLTAEIKLKVPRLKLDTILRQIAPLAIEIDYRTVDAEDVTIQLLREKLRQERIDKKQRRISNAIDNKGRKLNDVMDAEYSLDAALEEADRSKISQYDINERIEYSTIDIKLYQKQNKYTEKVLREKALKRYEPSLGSEALDALSNGWLTICSFFILLLNIWPIILIAAAVVFFILKYKKKNNKS